MTTGSIILLSGGIVCLILSLRGRGQEERLDAGNFPELSGAEIDEAKILVAVINRRTLYLGLALLVVGLISALGFDAALKLYGLFFILAIFWGNVVPRNRLYRIMSAREIPPAILRGRGLKL